jgi:hypothetical protein
MPTILQDAQKSAIDEDATRKRLFAFLTRPDGSIEEIQELTKVPRGCIAEWMVSLPFGNGCTETIAEALDRIDLFDNGPTIGGAQ